MPELPDWLAKRVAEGIADDPGCTSAYLTEEAVQHICKVQAVMLEGAKPVFTEKNEEDLRVVIRLTVEFYYYLQTNCTHQDCAAYVSDSILWGAEWYQRLTHTYRILEGSTESRIDWSRVSGPSLKEHYVSMFRDFDREILFETKCRLLLDLFKLQIFFAAVSYD